MLKVIVLSGCPASGKSLWAKNLIKEDPSFIRINNDDLRQSIFNSIYTPNNEKIITKTRLFLLVEALKKDRNVVIDNLNADKRHFNDVVRIATKLNKDIQIIEKLFYIDLETALERNAKREGAARVPDDVIEKFWKKLGGKQFSFKRPRVEIIKKQNNNTIEYNKNLQKAVIFDNDGTISLIHSARFFYDASTCDQDIPNWPVIECMKLYYQAGYKILFVSGREEKDRAPTERFYNKYFPEVKYELFMRPTGNSEQDVIIKERIFNEHIKDKYYIAGWYDDRLQVCRWVYEMSLPLFRVGDPESDF